MLSIDELMKPRYEVIADYPFSPYKIGDLMKQSPHGSFYLTKSVQYVDGKPVDTEDYVIGDVAKRYPALFKPLQWWEHRKPEDMPEYVKHGNNGKVRKIIEYTPTIEVMEFEGGRTRRINAEWLPSTIEEYNQQTRLQQ